MERYWELWMPCPEIVSHLRRKFSKVKLFTLISSRKEHTLGITSRQAVGSGMSAPVEGTEALTSLNPRAPCRVKEKDTEK